MIQDPIEIDTSWLLIGHVDEVISFVPAYTPKGFVMLVASPFTAKTILQGLQKEGKGNLKLLEGKLDRNGQPIEKTVSEILGDADWIAFNDAAQALIDVTELDLAYALGLFDPGDVIEVPVLFDDYLGLGFAEAYTPNMVNLLAVRGYDLVIPKPFGPNDSGTDKFEQYMSDELEPLGPMLSFIDDWTWYHISHGEVHCGTNARRAPDEMRHWWEQQ